MAKIYFLGECMVELSSANYGDYTIGYAGDVYNSAIYAKRMQPSLDVGFVSAVGDDDFSQNIIASLADEQINIDNVATLPRKSAGLYIIKTDAEGERSFSYWRDTSAAKSMMTMLPDIKGLGCGDCLFISGISLAIINQKDRKAFWQLIRAQKDKGIKIIFDPNYRARLWPTAELAKQEFEQAFALADVCLPGIEDLTVLYGCVNTEQCLAFLGAFAINEIVIKDGANKVCTLLGSDYQEHAIEPVSNVVDTTSAGDAFNGGYLASRLTGNNVEIAVSHGARLAAAVIQYSGAIIPAERFNKLALV